MTNKLSTLIVSTIGALIASPAFSTPSQSGGSEYHHMFGNYGSMGMFMGPIFMIVWVVVLVVIIALVLKWLGLIGGRSTSTSSSALGILEERFAKGDIDKKQFEAMRKELKT